MTTTLTFTDAATSAEVAPPLAVEDDYHVGYVDIDRGDLGTDATPNGASQIVTPKIVGGSTNLTVVDSKGTHTVSFGAFEGRVRITAKLAPPTTGGPPALPAIPSGYRQTRLLDFAEDAAAQALVKRRTAGRGQGGIECWCKPENVTFDSLLGLRLATRMEEITGGDGVPYHYSGAYCDIGSANAADRLPLSCRVQYLARFPYTALHWNSLWNDANGSATGPTGFESDCGEMFTSQTPGYINFQVHQPGSGPKSKNLIRGNGDGTATAYGSTKINGQAQGPRPLAPGTPPGTSRYGVQSYAYDVDGATPGHTDWHLIEVEYRKVAAGTGWRLAVDFYIDGHLCVTWTDTYSPTNGTPSWFLGDETKVWDIRVDNWVGGLDIQRATLNGKPLLVPDGKRQDGSTTYQAPASAMPPPTLWQQDPKAVYYLDVAAVRILTRS